MSISGHDDAASTIRYSTARKLLERRSGKGRRLLELFAREQILPLESLLEEFDTHQNGLNAILGSLTRRFHQIQGDAGFYIYIPKMRAWAVGRTSRTNLRRALREDERSRQRRLSFSGD